MLKDAKPRHSRAELPQLLTGVHLVQFASGDLAAHGHAERLDHIERDQRPRDLIWAPGERLHDTRHRSDNREVQPWNRVARFRFQLWRGVELEVFSDLRRPPVEREHYRQPLSLVCLQQFLYENGTQLCSYLVCRFVFDQGLGARKEFDQNAVL